MYGDLIELTILSSLSTGAWKRALDEIAYPKRHPAIETGTDGASRITSM